MALTDRLKPEAEFLDTVLFFCERQEIGKKGCCLVISGGIASPDFVLDVAPDAFAPAANGLKPHLACAPQFRLMTLVVTPIDSRRFS
ncbi:hypothetical protein [Mesorhizobium captivum]|uniref:hypothetical protein n=1 Tax=Mesorhizobium captivum TaxID=3072319 RepID=UPI002A24EAE0|nr:hypothetical protein [Mesorhizobium sp. VK3C]MDX8446517.1 hypothetical protein [Mesorhizobium sp. VK3C]